MQQLRGGLPVLLRDGLVELLVEFVGLELGLAGWGEGYRKETPSMSLLTMRIIKYDNGYHLGEGARLHGWSIGDTGDGQS